MSEFVLLVNLAATHVMVGVIWFLQIVHYPLMAQVSRQKKGLVTFLPTSAANF